MLSYVKVWQINEIYCKTEINLINIFFDTPAPALSPSKHSLLYFQFWISRYAEKLSKAHILSFKC